MAVTVQNSNDPSPSPAPLALIASPHASGTHLQSSPGFEKNPLDSILQEICNPELVVEQVIAQIIRLIEQHAICDELWLVRRESPSSDQVAWMPFKVNTAHQVADSTESSAHATQAIQNIGLWALQHCKSADQTSRDGKQLLIATPIQGTNDSREVLVSRVQLAGNSSVRLVWLLSLIAQAYGSRQRGLALRSANDQLQFLRQCQSRIDLMATTEHRTDLAIELANFLKQITNSNQVAVALADHRQIPQLAAVSDVEHFEPQASSIVLYKQAIAERSIDVDAWRIENKSNDLSVGSHWPRLAEVTQSSQIVYWPIGSYAEKLALFILVGNWSPQQLAQIQQLQQQWTQSLSLQLQQWFRARRTVQQRLVSTAKRWYRSRTARQWLIAASCVCLLMLIPMPCQLNCDAIVQPVFRRFITTPFEGTLSESLVLAGDTVEPGQVLARLDGAQLRMELAGLDAEYAAARKKTNAALAQGNISDSQIADSDSKRIQAKINLLQTRLNDLEIRSPIAGVIVSGDLTKSTGAPLQKGQVLFEVAPLAGMQVELHVPESDVRLVRPEQSIELQLSAFPFHQWKTKLQRIQPRAEIIDQANVFVAEAAIENFNDQLRPGMKGHAEISIGWKSIGWIWFHRVWERVQYQWVW